MLSYIRDAYASAQSKKNVRNPFTHILEVLNRENWLPGNDYQDRPTQRFSLQCMIITEDDKGYYAKGPDCYMVIIEAIKQCYPMRMPLNTQWPSVAFFNANNATTFEDVQRVLVVAAELWRKYHPGDDN